MKFSHIADCHIGAWRDEKLKDLNTQAFFRAIAISEAEKVDFILIAGDLFNTALPGIDLLKEVAKIFKRLTDKGIQIYLIAGSHDFSPSGKTMLDVLEEAGLCINVTKGSVVGNKLRLKFTVDKKTGAKITGMLGRRGMLERSYYEELDTSHLEKEQGFKIFMFHTSITELKPSAMAQMESSPISLLPKGFDYYAGGHVHIVEKLYLPGYKNVIYPGPLFPNNFHELGDLKSGGFYIYDDGEVRRIDLEMKKVVCIDVDADNKTPESAASDIIEQGKDIKDAIVLIRVSGTLFAGKTSDLDFRKIYERFYEKGAYFIMRNTAKLSSKEYEEIKVESSSVEDIEEKLINEHIGQIGIWDEEKEKRMIKTLMSAMSQEKKEGEKVYEFEDRLLKELEHLLGI
ncbi:MAG: exonuclease SbcCD subunit D [archaeon]